jgi:MAF protein
MNPRTLVLASASPYRRQLLERLQIPFKACAPSIDETARPDESPESLVQRLALEKAQALRRKFNDALIIGSDQMAVLGEKILGKPGSFEHATEQLQQCQGRSVTFQTGLCLLDAVSGDYQLDCIPFTVQFRALSRSQIERYVQQEKPYDSAGSFKSEALGIALFEKMLGDDPTALIGLPLIRLTSMLNAAGMVIP